MRAVIRVVFWVFVFVLLAGHVKAQAIICRYLIPATVRSVPDSNALEIETPTLSGGTWRGIVRLRDVDAPSLTEAGCEQEKAMGQAARAGLEKLIPKDKRVLLCFPVSIGEGKVEANVATFDGVNLGRMLLKQGLVRRRSIEGKHSWCPKETV